MPPITQLVAIDDFLIDCSLRETHTYDSEVTEYPVESGSNITDNIRPLPIVVEMECLVSNTPIGVIVPYRNLVRGEEGLQYLSKPADDAYELLTLIRDQRKPVTIRTSLRTYENMALKSLSIPRGAHLDELRFTATFQQIQTVENKRTIRVAIPTATGKKNVSKPPVPSDIRQILIDPYNFAWFDPDVGLWRKKAKWISVSVIDEDSPFVTTVNTRGLWHLYRKTTYPVSHVPGPRERTGTTFNGSTVNLNSPWVPPLVLVTLSQCKLHNFTIEKTFGGINQPFTSERATLKGRTL